MRSSRRRICSRSPQFFLRLRRAHQGFSSSPAAGLGARFLEQLFQAAFGHASCSSKGGGGSISSSRSHSCSNSNSQARDKGVAPDTGPWPGAAGLRSSRSVQHCDTNAAYSSSLSLPSSMPPQAVPFARLVCILGHPLARQAACVSERRLDEVVMCPKIREKAFWHAVNVNFFSPRRGRECEIQRRLRRLQGPRPENAK